MVVNGGLNLIIEFYAVARRRKSPRIRRRPAAAVRRRHLSYVLSVKGASCGAALSGGAELKWRGQKSGPQMPSLISADRGRLSARRIGRADGRVPAVIPDGFSCYFAFPARERFRAFRHAATTRCTLRRTRAEKTLLLSYWPVVRPPFTRQPHTMRLSPIDPSARGRLGGRESGTCIILRDT